MNAATQWVAWILLTVAWNAINTANSRAQNSSSWRYNAVTTLVYSALYITSLLLVADQLLASKQSGRYALILLAVALYAVASSVGGVAGQVAAMRWEARHHRKPLAQRVRVQD